MSERANRLAERAIRLGKEVFDEVQGHSLRLNPHEAQIVDRRLFFYTGEGKWLLIGLNTGRVYLTDNRPDQGPWNCKKAPPEFIASAINTMKRWLKILEIVNDWKTYEMLANSQLAEILHLAASELTERGLK